MQDIIARLLDSSAKTFRPVAVISAGVEAALEPAPLAQAGQPRAKADHKPLADIERLESTSLTRSIACPTGRVTLSSRACVVIPGVWFAR